MTRAGEDLRFDGRVAVVTGAGGGLGREYALLLASRGAKVVVNDLGTTVAGDGRDEARAPAVAAEIEAAGGSAVASTDSVTTTVGAEAIVGTALDAFGAIDIVINNAGISVFRPFAETTLDEFVRHLDVHLVGSFNVTKAAWPQMVQRGFGRVVMTASSAIFGLADLEAYSSAKAGLIGLGRSLALAGASHGIKVNIVAPAAATRMWAQAGAPPSDVVAQMRPDQAAALVGFLCHDSCPVSGELYRTAGGRVSRVFIAETDGAFAETPEEVGARLEEISDVSRFFVPADSAEINARAMELVKAQADATGRRP